MISKKRLKQAAIPLRKLRLRLHKQRSLSAIRKPTYTHCKNCGKQLTEMYCPRCGQYALVTHQTLKQTVVSYFENNYSFDKNLLQSLIYLFFKPGFLAKEYMNGKIARHIHPFKLYFFASILLFSIVFTVEQDYEHDAKTIYGYIDSINIGNDSLNQQTIEAVIKQKDSLGLISNEEKEQIEKSLQLIQNKKTGFSKQATLSTELEKATQGGFWAIVVEKLKTLTYGEFKAKFMRNLSFSFLILMPLFALILFLLFSKREKYYVAHLIHTIHIHVVMFLLMVIGHLWSTYISDSDAASTILFFLFFLYFFYSLRRFYNDSRKKTILKGVIALNIYFFLAMGASVFLILSTIII